VAEKKTTRRKDELEQQEGGSLPKREVMSILSTNPGLISIPEDPTAGGVEQPGPPDDELNPPPRYDV
jgi:hypothetical protein